MSQTIITLAFEQYKAQQEAIAAPVELNEFVLANVPNQDASLPIDRNEALPPQAQIVFVGDVSQAGYVNPNAVVYSLIMDTRIGDFDFNWIGLRNKASGVIAAISHIPTVHKLKTVLGVQNGNSVTRSIMMSYNDAMGLTNIDVDASTWQIDFTARLFGMDEAERLANIDVFGQAAFLSDGFKVEKSGSDYIANAGRGYVDGLRCHLNNDLTLSNITNSIGIYLDASWQGQLTSQWQTVFEIKPSASVLVDYVDGNGYQHYVTKIADVDGAGNVTDTRYLEGFAEYYQQAAVDDLLDKKIEKSSITDSVTSASSILVASAKGLKAAYDKAVSAYNLANSKWTHRAASTSQTGTSQLSDSVTSTSSVLSATAKAVKTAYELAESKMTQATGDERYLGVDAKAKAASLADTVGIKTSPSTSFYDVTWHNGDEIYSCSSGEGFSYRPSDGFSRIKNGYIAGQYLYHRSDGKLIAHNTAKRSAGMYGMYDASKIAHIWSMGADYQISDTGVDFGNLYGLAYKHVNNGAGGIMANGHQAVWCEDGIPKAAMGSNGLWGLNVFDGDGNDRQRVYSPNNPPPAGRRTLLWSGSVNEGTATLSESYSEFDELIVLSNDGVFRSSDVLATSHMSSSLWLVYFVLSGSNFKILKHVSTNQLIIGNHGPLQYTTAIYGVNY